MVAGVGKFRTSEILWRVDGFDKSHDPWEKGRPETGTKANMIPIKTDRAMTGHLMKKGRGRRYKTAATAIPPAIGKLLEGHVTHEVKFV